MKKITILIVLIFICAVSFAQSTGITIFDNVDFKIETANSINTIGSDISPFFVGNDLFFSGIPEKYFNKNNRERKNMAFYSIYSTTLDSNGSITSERSLVPGFGAGFHEGPAAYCQATGELFVTLSNTTDPDYVHKMIPVEDIRLRLVIMKMIDNKWQIVEEFPYNDSDFHFAHPAISITGDTLIFSSDMEGGYGKSDLYLSVRKNGQWQAPINLGEKINTQGNEMFPTFIGPKILSFASDGHNGGYGKLDIWYCRFPDAEGVKNVGGEINSPFDDFGLVINREVTVGYFASNRPGKGSDDIFRLGISKQYNVISGKVIDDQTGIPIHGATVQLSDCSVNVFKKLFADNGGKFEVKVPANYSCLEIEASASGYEMARKDISGLAYTELRLKQLVNYEILVLDNESKNPVENAILSCGNKTWKTNTAGMGALKPDSVSGCQLSITKDGYLNQTFQIHSDRFLAGMNRDTVYLYKKELGKTFVLKNINYDFDKWDILPESEIELNKLVQILNDNPTLKVELGAHTDSRGNDQYNMRLSQKRSDAAVNYIVNKGIARSRITAKGYGESQLLNHCGNGVDCPEWEHRQNRRTEFRIIGL